MAVLQKTTLRSFNTTTSCLPCSLHARGHCGSGCSLLSPCMRPLLIGSFEPPALFLHDAIMMRLCPVHVLLCFHVTVVALLCMVLTSVYIHQAKHITKCNESDE